MTQPFEDRLGIHAAIQHAFPDLYDFLSAITPLTGHNGLFSAAARITVQVGPVHDDGITQRGVIVADEPVTLRTTYITWARVGQDMYHLSSVEIKDRRGTMLYLWNCTCGWDGCGSTAR